MKTCLYFWSSSGKPLATKSADGKKIGKGGRGVFQYAAFIG